MTLEVAKEIFAEAPFIQHLGLEPTAYDGEVLTACATIEPWMKQATGVCHAGVVTAVGDHVAAAATRLAAGFEYSLVTIELKSNFLRPATGVCLRAEGRPIKLGRTILVGEARVYAIAEDGSEHLCTQVQVTVFGGVRSSVR